MIKIFLVFSIALFALLLSFQGHAQFRVAGYYPTWVNYPDGINETDLSKLTHINIAFANPDTTGKLIPSDGTNADIATIVKACHAKNVKVFLSIGGAGAPGSAYKSLFSSAGNINSFVAKILDYTTNNNLDGIDVDIEGDVLDGTIITAAQYEDFVTKLAIALRTKDKQMSAALATWFGDFVSNTAAAQFDWIGVMSYDYAMSCCNPAGPTAPYSQVVSDYAYWHTTKGVPAAKLSIGLPFYGYGWGTYKNGGEEFQYCDIVSQHPGAESADKVGSGSNVIYYNGSPTIIQKTNFAIANAGGVMIWQITEDCNSSNPRSLLSAIDSTVHAGTTGIVDAQSNHAIRVFPNPAAGYAMVETNLQEDGSGTLTLCDLSGRMLELITTGAIRRNEVFTLNLADYPSGMYILKLNTDLGNSCYKVSKQ